MIKSLKIKTWLSLLATMSFFILVLWLLEIVFLQNFYEFSKEFDAKKIQTTIIRELSDGDLRESYEEVIDISRRNDLFVLVYDGNGQILYHPFLYVDKSMGRVRVSVEDIMSGYKLGEVVTDMIESGKQTDTVKMRNSHNMPSNLVLVNKFENGSRTYYAVSRTQLAPVQATSDILERILLIILLLVFVLSVIISFVLAESVCRPIINLSSAVKKVAKGDYNVKIMETREDEVGILQKDFNYMTNELSKVDNIRKDLIANVSHELRTPLTLIKGYAETIKDITGNNPSKRDTQLEIIIDETDRLSDLISNMLDLSKLQAGKVEFYRQETNISELVEKLGKRYEIFEDKGYEFIYDICPDVYVNCDVGRIEQVFCNLIDNAINHSVETKIVKITLDENKNFKVNNKGDIIEQSDLPFIWDRYYKIDKSGNRRVAGTGIGLSIVKEILVAHNYEFGVVSNDVEGTTFWVNFENSLD